MAKSKIKVPKRVAGVKIPKTVRKGPVMQFVNSSAGRMLIAEALTAAVAALAYKGVNSDSPTGQRLRDAGKRGGDALADGTARLSYAFGEGVRAFREALASPSTVGDVAEPDADSLSAKKKSRPSRSETSMSDGL